MALVVVAVPGTIYVHGHHLRMFLQRVCGTDRASQARPGGDMRGVDSKIGGGGDVAPLGHVGSGDEDRVALREARRRELLGAQATTIQ